MKDLVLESTTAARRRGNPRNARRVAMSVVHVGVLCLALSTAGLLQRTSEVQARAVRVAPSPVPCPQAPPSPRPADTLLGPVDWIFLIDFSASMAGLEPGAPNIFPCVQSTLRWFITSAIQDGDSLTVYGFARDSTRILRMDNIKADDRMHAIRQLDALRATGPRTHTGAALKDGLEEVRARATAQPRRPAAIVLLTDGQEDVKTIPHPTKVEGIIRDMAQLIRDEHVPYVFYVSLGTKAEPKLQQFLDQINQRAPNHGQLIEDQGAKQLWQRAIDVRTQVARARRAPPVVPSVTPPKPQSLTLDPPDLDLGRIHPGGRGGPYSINVSSPVPATVRVTLLHLPARHLVTGLPEELKVGTNQSPHVTFYLSPQAEARQGVESFTLQFDPVALPPTLSLKPAIVALRVHVAWTWWERISHAVGSVIVWIARHWLGVLLTMLGLLATSYLVWRWYVDEDTILDLLRQVFPWPGQGTRGMLQTSEGPITLGKDEVTLGKAGSRLTRSTATISIRREGDRHAMEVKEGVVTLQPSAGKLRSERRQGARCTLEPGCRISLPCQDSQGPYLLVTYYNSSRARRR